MFFGSYTDFKNPFITNYEQRFENTLGFRSFLDYSQIKTSFKFNAQAGLESSATKSQIKNFDNLAGQPTAIQAYDRLKANTDFGFLRLNFDFDKKLLLELASSLNCFNYQYTRIFPIQIDETKRKFKVEFMPKVALSYLVSNRFSVRASTSKGYSPPSLSEIRSSDNKINTDLQAELGWNYELGLRYKTINNHFYFNANIFRYTLNDAIVRRLNQNDIEYFINAGGTKQKGLELETSVWIFQNKSSFISGFQLTSNYTYSHFRFDNFSNGLANFSGNKLTGVPATILVSNFTLDFKKGLYLFGQHNFTSTIPLDDTNTVFSKKYNLIELKTGIRHLKIAHAFSDFFVGVNNLLNEKYSLGNDLNAANGRYFNPAATVNFYAGVSIKL